MISECDKRKERKKQEDDMGATHFRLWTVKASWRRHYFSCDLNLEWKPPKTRIRERTFQAEVNRK